MYAFITIIIIISIYRVRGWSRWRAWTPVGSLVKSCVQTVKCHKFPNDSSFVQVYMHVSLLFYFFLIKYPTFYARRFISANQSIMCIYAKNMNFARININSSDFFFSNALSIVFLLLLCVSDPRVGWRPWEQQFRFASSSTVWTLLKNGVRLGPC